MFPVNVFFTKFTRQLPNHLWNSYIELLPDHLREENSRFFRWQNRHAHLFGRLLLLKGLEQYGYDQNIFLNLKKDEYSQPYLEGKDEIDFNISHSGEYVLCAHAKKMKLGVDIEKVRDINFHYLEKTMTPEQWEHINKSTDQIMCFFKYWIKKESIIKADGRGLSIPLTDVHIENDTGCYDHQHWFLNELKIDENYCAGLAASKKNIIVNLKKIDFEIPPPI